MTLKKNTFVLAGLWFIALTLLRCNSNSGKEKTGTNLITPVELESYVEGFNFPEDSNKIYRWVNANDSASIFKHAWGVWAGLTEPTNQTYAGDRLLVFETWQGIDDVRDNILADSLTAGCTGANSKKERTKLTRPEQFTRKEGTKKLIFAHAVTSASPDTSAGFWVTVSYSPDAACYVTQNQLLKQSVLNKYRTAGGIGRIPPFPQKSVTIKPTYFVGEEKDHLIRIPAVTEMAPDSGVWGSANWPKCIYADVQNRQPKNKKLVPAAINDHNADHIALATCNVSDFIHFKVDQTMANHMNKADSTEGLSSTGRATAGQLALLVAMHVTTKEISNWTWQTFYWAPDPDRVYRPSSALAARLRPKELKGAAGHYALNAGYAMVIPNQPITGGTNKGVRVLYSYNPYLEGGFAGLGPDTTFQKASPLIKGNPYGVQTNCMTCHALATSDDESFYETDQYVDMNDKFFKNKVQLDFAWSLHDNMITEPALSAKKVFMKKLVVSTKSKK